MRFDIISLFPESFTSYFETSILKRAQEKQLVLIETHHLRDFAHDRHKTVDDTPYGGGAGMVLKIEPLVEAVEFVKNIQPLVIDHTVLLKTSSKRTMRTILFSAKGKTITQTDIRRLAKYDRLILICGRYEGVDERVTHFIDEELSIGDYVLTGGELPAMVLVDTVTRLLSGVLGNSASAEHESHTEIGVLEHPQYTKPEIFREMRVPEVLLSGHHAEIAKWRREHSRIKNNVSHSLTKNNHS
ncbi:MAG: tRNA (guanosine(37)-N1)-methyltransferase TrmD [Minisyncoccota bacterium]